MHNLHKLANTNNGVQLLLADIVREFGDKLERGERAARVWSDSIDALSCGYYVKRDFLIEIYPDGPDGHYVINSCNVTRLPAPTNS